MATATMPPPAIKRSPVEKKLTGQDPTPREIIAAGRAAPVRTRGALWLGLLGAALSWASFTPLDAGFLGWFALLPWLLLTQLKQPSPGMYRSLYWGGLAFWLPTLQWMRLGDHSMYIALGALSVYLAFYVPLCVWLIRVARLRMNIPLVVAAPLVWVGGEYLRNFLMTGFGWYMLGHSQYRWLGLIQISDLVGTYGVSAVMVAMTSLIVLWMPTEWLSRLRLLPPGTSPETGFAGINPRGRMISTVAVSLVLVSTLIYGAIRRGQPFEAGPRVAVVQGNVPAAVQSDVDWNEVYRRHLNLTAQAVKLQPDLILWPEVMFPYPHFLKPRGMSDAELKRLVPDIPASRWEDDQTVKILHSISEQARAGLVIGMETVTADEHGLARYNSAAMITPEGGFRGHYDKQHRVPFGEYIPLGEELPILGRFSPYRGNFGIAAGQQGVGFTYKNRVFAPVICFEDTVPHVVRKTWWSAAQHAKQPKVDVLLNLSNDGWFHGSSEHEQHLITAAFRCVELRTPLVRAANMGISAIIDGDGAIRTRAWNPETKRSKQTEAVLCDFVPLDNRYSLYRATGDWFAAGCLAFCGACLGWGIFRRTSTPTEVSATSGVIPVAGNVETSREGS